MRLNLNASNQIYKKLFSLKLPRRDGLILTVHPIGPDAFTVRFLHATFSFQTNLLALSDNANNIFLLNFNKTQYWNLANCISSISIIVFSSYKANELLVGDMDGIVHVIDVQTGVETGSLLYHSTPVKSITFAGQSNCMTCSTNKVIIWDLRCNAKIQALSIEHSPILKFAVFEPISASIITCFENDVLQVRDSTNYSLSYQIQPKLWGFRSIKSYSFTQNGQIMLLGFRTPFLALFQTTDFKLLKLITLPESFQGLKSIDFIPEANDGGSNRFIVILTSQGFLHFYSIMENKLIGELKANCEICKVIVAKNGTYIACILSSGDVNVYITEKYLYEMQYTKRIRARYRSLSVKSKKMKNNKSKIRCALSSGNLPQILRKCGEFPEQHRNKIWEQLLQLPDHKIEYNSVINHRMIDCFNNLQHKYPLENKRNLTNLRRLLDNVITWAPFFHNVDYLPNLVFPFVKTFKNKPIACFEAVCTILMNWCQLWFEYFPLPPINILAMVENLLIEHDPELLSHFHFYEVPSSVYAWLLLKTVFSEVLTAETWKIYWDHVLTNEIAFYLCGVSAYLIIKRNTILACSNQRQIINFFNTTRPIHVGKLIKKTYYILNNTEDANHPRRYLQPFHAIEIGRYPDFCDYPKIMLKKEAVSMNLKQEFAELRSDELKLYKKHFSEVKKQEDALIQLEESARKQLVHKTLAKQIENEKSEVDRYRQNLEKLKDKLEVDFSPKIVLKEKDLSSGYVKELNETDQSHKSSNLNDSKEMVNLFTALIAMDRLIKKVEDELEVEQNGKRSNGSLANELIKTLKEEAIQLEEEYKRLVKLFERYKT